MNYTDGKNRSESLNSLLSAGSNNPFKTYDRNMFVRNLEHMSLEEMGYLCNKVNVKPTTIRSKMEASLLEAFDKYQNKQKVYLDDSLSDPAPTGFEDLL